MTEFRVLPASPRVLDKAHPSVSRRAAILGGASAAALGLVGSAAAQEATPAPDPATAPLSGFDIYVAGLHCAKEEPEMQMEAHHYCKQVEEGVFQCALFDGNSDTARLIGLEYIIAEARFLELPEDEQAYWHPHNYEVFSGQLVAPTLPAVAEQQLMQVLVNSYGKTWHAWHTGRPDGAGEAGDPLPLGPAMLQWSFNHDGEADESLLQHFNESLGINPDQKRQERTQFVPQANPQEGVNALQDAFPNASTETLPGVEDAGDINATPTA